MLFSPIQNNLMTHLVQMSLFRYKIDNLKVLTCYRVQFRITIFIFNKNVNTLEKRTLKNKNKNFLLPIKGPQEANNLIQ